MERNKNGLVIATIALAIVSIVSIGLAYAAFNRDLTIVPQATYNPNAWKVNFKAGTLTSTKSAGATIDGTPSLGLTSLTNIAVTFTEENDFVEYKFKVENTGESDAIIDALNLSSKSCVGEATSPIDKSADELGVCSGFNYTLKYVTTNTAVAVGDTLDSGTEKELILRLEYTGTFVPTDDVVVSIPGGIVVSYISTP